MIDHVMIKVGNLEASVAFYEQALAPLGYARGMYHPGFGCGFTLEGHPEFWVVQAPPEEPIGRFHLALRARSRDLVEQFHVAALAAGGTDNGAPGVRTDYHPHYYGAFVLDPDGHNIEAVIHTPQ